MHQRTHSGCKNVKLDDLAIFSVASSARKVQPQPPNSPSPQRQGAETPARATGELSNAQINLEGQLKETSQYNVDDSSSSGGTPPDNGEEENPLANANSEKKYQIKY